MKWGHVHTYWNGKNEHWSEHQFSWHCVRSSAKGLRNVTKNLSHAVEIEASRWWVRVIVWLWHDVARVLEKHTAAPFRVGVTEGQYFPPKRRWLPTTLHGVTSLKNTNSRKLCCFTVEICVGRSQLQTWRVAFLANLFAFSVVKFVSAVWDAGESGSSEVLRKGRRLGVNIYPPTMKPLMCHCCGISLGLKETK